MPKAADKQRKTRSRSLHYFMIHCKPAPGSANARHGGAYLSCWVNYPHDEGALALAKFYLRHFGGRVRRVEEHRMPTRRDYLRKPELRYFDEAIADGACFVPHVYPKKRRLLRAARRKHVD